MAIQLIINKEWGLGEAEPAESSAGVQARDRQKTEEALDRIRQAAMNNESSPS